MGKRLARDPRGVVGNARNRANGHACREARRGLEHSTHSHRVATEPPSHPDFGRSLIGGPRVADIDASLQGQLAAQGDLVEDRTEP